MAKWINVLHADCSTGMRHKVHTQLKAYYLKLVSIWCLSVGGVPPWPSGLMYCTLTAMLE